MPLQRLKPFAGAKRFARADELDQMDYSIHFHNWEPADFLELMNHCVRELIFPMGVDLFTALGEEMIVVLRRTA